MKAINTETVIHDWFDCHKIKPSDDRPIMMKVIDPVVLANGTTSREYADAVPVNYRNNKWFTIADNKRVNLMPDGSYWRDFTNDEMTIYLLTFVKP